MAAQAEEEFHEEIGEQQELLEKKGKGRVSVEELTAARNAFFMWTFVAYVAWGILVELYTYLFDDVIDGGSYAKVHGRVTLNREPLLQP